MSEIKEYFVDRVMSFEESKELYGEMVTAREPNVTEAGVYRDRETGEPVLIYAPYPGDVAALRRATMNVKMTTSLRANGMRNKARTFGFFPRSVVRKREMCKPTSLTWEHPESQLELSRAAVTLGQWFRDVLPDAWEDDLRLTDQILPEWRMAENTLWTSGVINETSQLPYHRDRGNFPVWSAMPVLRRSVEGGYLHIPEYDVTVACRDGWVLYFNGYEKLHGVTPMKTTKKSGYRFSIVYYALRGMKDCHTYAVELGEARRKRTAREDDDTRNPKDVERS
jgi:hypothetical protein